MRPMKKLRRVAVCCSLPGNVTHCTSAKHTSLDFLFSILNLPSKRNWERPALTRDVTIHSRDRTRYWVHENETRWYFNNIFKKFSVTKYISGECVLFDRKLQNAKQCILKLSFFTVCHCGRQVYFLVCHSAWNLISQDLEAQNLFTLLEFTYNPLLCTDQCLHVSLENLNSRCSRWRVFSYESKMKSLKMLLYSIKAHLCMVCPSIFLYARIKCGLLYSEWCIT